MTEENVRQEIRRLARDGKAPCEALLALAERLGVAPAEVGKACDELGIRICACQLGCFR